jgi:hypothetical protein
MDRKLSLAAGLVVAPIVLGPHVASAGVAKPLTSGIAEAGDALVQKADWDDWRYRRYRRYDYNRDHYRDYSRDYYRDYRYNDRCYYWRRECASRWGWGGGDYRWCLGRHGC